MANSNLGCGPLTVKYLVFIFNFLFFLSGLILIAVGGVAQGFFSSYMEFFSGRYVTPAIGVIILGSVIVAVSFFGCCGAKRENVFMLRIFAFLMIVVLLLEFAAAITVAVMQPNIKKVLEKNMNESMINYGAQDSLVTKSWDDMQTRYKCCGTFNYTDWKDLKYGMNVTGVPDSCCVTKDPGCGHNIFSLGGDAADTTTAAPVEDTIYHKGCYEALADAAHANLGAIIAGTVIIAILQIVGIWMSFCLIRAVKERYEIL